MNSKMLFLLFSLFTFCIATLDCSVLIGFLFCDFKRFLLVQGEIVDVPVLGDVPAGFQGELLGVIIGFFGLKPGTVVSLIPFPVAVSVDEHAEVILPWPYEVEFCSSFLQPAVADGLV